MDIVENVNEVKPCIEPSWKKVLANEFKKPYVLELKKFLLAETANKTIFPKGSDIFKAFEYTPFNEVKVVILGQDPYHGVGQAHGLCFSVKPQVPTPPSLQNIYKELKNDLNIAPVSHGCLISWAKQGVLLLNSVLTVEMSKPASHQGRGWESFTSQVIELLNAKDSAIAFVLWGAYAQQKGKVIDASKHLIIRSAHPSPFSANRGFFGSKPFSKINNFLKANGQEPINWQLPSKLDSVTA